MSTKADEIVAEIKRSPQFATCARLYDIALEGRGGDAPPATADLVMAIIMISAKAVDPVSFLEGVADSIKNNPLVDEIRGAVH